MSGSYLRQELLRALSRIERSTGKRYARLATFIDGVGDEKLSRELIAEFQRLAGDVEQEIAIAKRQGNRDAWQRGKVY